MNFADLSYFDYSYLILLILFAVFFGIKGATRSISYSLKIILSISLPFIFYKRVLNFSLEKLNIEYLFSLQNKNVIFLEIISFIILFLITYIIYSILEKALNLKSPSQLEFKILDTILGSIYGVILFSILFYFSYIAFFKNYIDDKNKIMKLNISIYENLMYKELQHRGQEGCGIVSYDGKNYYSEKRFGLVGDNFNNEDTIKKLPGNYAIGHNRYSTTGGKILRNVQPFFADTNAGGIGVSHNGNFTNAITLRKELVKDGAIFYTTSDSETIVQLIARSKKEKNIEKIIEAISQIQGGYALVMLTKDVLIGARDIYGIRPLVIGKINNSYVFASETCALDIIGAEFIREVENGEIIYIENNELNSLKPFGNHKPRPCVFEYIYFARPDSILRGKTAYEYRKNLGRELAKEDDVDADLVVPVPDSGNAAAIGYSQQKKINFDLGLIRNHYVGRTFIEPGQQIRSLGVKLKLNANRSSIENKKIILVDDSLVRGTTSHKIVRMLYDAGAKEVHLRIACPEIRFPDFYGVDMPTKKELLAANKSVEEICDYVKAKSLKFLSLDGLYIALGYLKRDNNMPQLTDHYFTGDYPIKLIDQLGDNKITQLSLLSSGSNI